MDLGEQRQGLKGDRAEKNNEEKDVETRPVKSNNHRKARKNDSERKSKNLRGNPPQNRRESSRSRSRSRSQSRQPSTASSKKSWKSPNAWLNFMQDFRENLRGFPALRKANAFRLAGEQWSGMSPEEKKPYIDAANNIKRKKKQESSVEQKKKSKPKLKATESEPTSKVKNQKKRNRGEENYKKSDSESETETEASAKTMESDNASVDTDGSI